VRDRATLYLEQLGGSAGGTAAITAPWRLPGANLEPALQAYLDGPTDTPFDLVGLKCREERFRVFTLLSAPAFCHSIAPPVLNVLELELRNAHLLYSAVRDLQACILLLCSLCSPPHMPWRLQKQV